MYLYPFASPKILLLPLSFHGMEERQSSEFVVAENRKRTGTSVICETFIPRDCRIYFYVPGSSNFVQWCGERACEKREKKRRNAARTKEPYRSADYSTYSGLSLHFATFRSHRTVFYVFAKSRSQIKKEAKNISVLKKQKNVGSSIIFLVRAYKKIHAKMDAFKID